jgi:endonuclease/exonuclease/phosphatase family metal-dependent hydrolase
MRIFILGILAVLLVFSGAVLLFGSAAHTAEAPAKPLLLKRAHAPLQIEPAEAESVPGVIDLEAEAAEALPHGGEFTILTFNIRSGNDADGNHALHTILEEIRETDADIIGLQEVERMMPRSGFADQAKIIAEALGYHFFYGGNINVLGVQYGNALLSRFPILEAKNHRLPRELLEPRGVIEAVVEVQGTPVQVYVTHLGLNAGERTRQIRAINERLAEQEGPLILMGDFNNLLDSAEMTGLDPRLIDTAAALGQYDAHTFAFYSDVPNVRIDRIYVSDDIIPLYHGVLSARSSDHLRVLSKVFHHFDGAGRNSLDFSE